MNEYTRELKVIRMKQGIGLHVIAGKLGISTSAVSQYERLDKQPSNEYKNKLFGVLKLPDSERERLESLHNLYRDKHVLKGRTPFHKRVAGRLERKFNDLNQYQLEQILNMLV